MKLFQKFFLNKPSFAQSETPVITLLFSKPPKIDLSNKIIEISNYEATRNKPKAIIEQDWDTGGILLAEVNYDEHVIEIAGFQSPLPAKVMEETIYAAPWSADFKELLQSHLSNIILCYNGTHTDPIEQYLSLYKVASLFDQDGFLGVVNEPSWTCHPAHVVKQILEPKMLSICRQSPPLVYWTGFVRGQLGDQYWALSKGHHLFEVPDFAVNLDYESDLMQINELFHEIFHYCYFENAEIQNGDALQIDDDHFYLFSEPSEDLEALKGLGDLFIIETVSQETIDSFDDWNNMN